MEIPSIIPGSPASFAPRARRFVAGVCLMAMVSAFTGTRLLALLLVAWVDGGHTPWIVLRGDGVELVLHHELESVPVPGETRRSAGHDHGLPARIMVLFTSEHSADGDHVILIPSIRSTPLMTGASRTDAAPLGPVRNPPQHPLGDHGDPGDSSTSPPRPRPLPSVPPHLRQHWVTVLLV